MGKHRGGIRLPHGNRQRRAPAAFVGRPPHSSSSSVSPCQPTSATTPGKAPSTRRAHRAAEGNVRGARMRRQPMPTGTCGARPRHHHDPRAGMSRRAARTRIAGMREQGGLCRIARLGPGDGTTRSQEWRDRAAGGAAAPPSVTQRGRGERRRFTAPAPRVPLSPRPFGTAAAAGEVQWKNKLNRIKRPGHLGTGWRRRAGCRRSGGRRGTAAAAQGLCLPAAGRWDVAEPGPTSCLRWVPSAVPGRCPGAERNSPSASRPGQGPGGWISYPADCTAPSWPANKSGGGRPGGQVRLLAGSLLLSKAE